ncbi:hypothetical protein [[Enterobacter] lignolyticus]|uniref:Copper-binding protein PcoE n=1 Tax=Enterobacter lignolyticus (strain SCF1) TaxID=701347 RepID=E3G5H6_ENTLS|nr:hypothetical protein [[Enterobacter] lignolyticus]ADO49501.1 putative copper-binding protein PcoE [[Enterobacter] lignolyticus SCF1]
MKKSIITAFIALGIASSAWAADAVDAHRQVNNAQAAAHQTAASAPAAAVAGNAMTMTEMNTHQKAMAAHASMNNSQAYAHQQQIEKHRKMMMAQQ